MLAMKSQKVNIKGDCKNCPDHGICAAEKNVPHYYCTKNEKKQ
jgi:hypothetical protein